MDENRKAQVQLSEQEQSLLVLSKKEKRAQRKAEKKEQRKVKKIQKKAAYKALPLWRKLLRIIVKLVVFVLLLFALRMALVAFITANIEQIELDALNSAYNTVLTDEMRDDFAPLDPEGAAQVESLAVYPKEDTWGIYVYLCGSNLESFHINEMSSVTEYLTGFEADKIASAKRQNKANSLLTFMDEIHSQGMDLPAFMYLPEQHIPYTAQSDRVEYGLLSNEINHMSEIDLPDNVNVVIQAGGSKRWSHPMLNPNRSCRLLLNNKEFKVVEDNLIRNVGDGETLADFLEFCKENYNADHKVLLLFDHGGASFGVCWDEIYADDNLSLDEIRQAFSSVYTANEKEPPFEMVGFHACLMSSVEVANALRGYSQYMVASEEILIDTGIVDRQSFWLTELAKNVGTNGARIGVGAVDGYMDFWTKLNETTICGIKPFDGLNITMNVIDIAKAGKAYDAYCELMNVALRDAVKDPSVLTAIAQAADSSIRYSGSSYRVYNTIDLGLFMDALSEIYPAQCAKVTKAIDNSVLYNRASGTLKQSKGLNVYFPLDVEGISGMNFFLEYINDICKDDATRALYYYKLAGCLNEPLQSFVESQGYGTAMPLDTSALKNIGYSPITVDNDGNFSIELPQDALSLVQNITYRLSKYNEDEQKVYYYGEDNFVNLDDTKLDTSFDGKWLCIGGQPLATEVINANTAAEHYKTLVSINDVDHCLTFAKDKESGEIVITSICKDGDDTALDNTGRGTVQLSVGDKLKPIYKYSSLLKEDNSDLYITDYGDTIRYSDDCKIELCSVPDANYLAFVTLTDIRGDEYYSGIVQLQIKNGNVENIQIMEDMMYSR